ncbi:hypothetical protein C5S29_01485 [ANME-1 cluster archaeon GoMg3.2]|nr:hypothetical protein [ANME-1 cluster archaeon GoMg3.2]
MAETQLLEKIADDVSFLKDRIIRIEEELNEINSELHEVRPEYMEKLKRIDKGKFLTREEFEKELEE